MLICITSEKMMSRLLLLLVLFISGAESGLDTSFCKPSVSTASDPIRPAIPKQFDVHLECNILNKNQTIDVHEFFDYKNNRDLLKQYSEGQKLEVHYDYNINELIVILDQPNADPQCQASALSAHQNLLLFGDQVTNGQNHIFSPSGAFHFNQDGVIEVYEKKDVVRGINVDKWYSCQYWSKMNATMNITWYFADANNWDTSIGLKQAPVQCHVTGRVQDSSSRHHDFDHVYNFFKFQNYIPDPTDFETPRGLQCPGRKNTKPLPPVAPAMSFISELIDERQKIVTFMKEQYDDHLKIVMFSLTPSVLTSSRLGPSRLDVVHDFNTGVQYIIDHMRGNCTTTKISKGMFDDATSDAQHVRIRTAHEFFAFNYVYTYEGVKNIRGVDCDTWVSHRTDYPAIMPQNSTWEWAFVSNNWTSAYDYNAKYKTPIPWQLTVTVPGMSVSTTVNVYEFDASSPRVFEFDISNCLANKRKRTFQFTMPASTTSIIVTNRVSFRYALLKSLLLVTSVSPLRISNLQTEIIKTIPTVTFDLLDVAPIKGDASVTVVEPSIDDAANRIISRISSGQFVVMLQSSPLADPQFIVPTANSLRELTMGAVGVVTSVPHVQKTTRGPFVPQQTTRQPVRTRPPTAAPARTSFPKPVASTSFPFQTFTDSNVQCQPSTDGYSAGTMAGVSVAMVIFGGVMGGGFAVLLSRRRRIG